MEFAAFNPATGAEMARDVVYAYAPRDGRDVALHVDIYRPAAAARPALMLVWLHGGDFHTGNHAHGGHRRLARWLTAAGVALATPQIRLGAGEADLCDDLRARLPGPTEAAPGVPAGPEALAAMEDIVRFLGWLEGARAAIGIRGRPVLGGSRAGAVSAFNVAFAAPWFGLERPEPGGILSFSGAFAWPELYTLGRCPVFALHNPADSGMPIGPVRRMAEADSGVELIEAPEQTPGAIRVWPNEPKRDFYGRIATLLEEWSAAAVAQG